MNKTTAAYYFTRLRILIARHLEKEGKAVFDGEIEVDESYFAAQRKGKRGRGSAGKVPVFGVLKRNGKVYTHIIADVISHTLMPIIKGKIVPDSIVYSGCCTGYNTLDTSGFRHYRIDHSKLFSERKNHINGIENFGNQAKRHLRRFNGNPKSHFHLFLKECEWRFNNREALRQLRQLKHWFRGN